MQALEPIGEFQIYASPVWNDKMNQGLTPALLGHNETINLKTYAFYP